MVMAFHAATQLPSTPQAAMRAWVVGGAAGVKPEGQQSRRGGAAAAAVCAHCGDGGVGRRGVGYRR